MQISQPNRLEVLVMLDLIIVQIIKPQFYLRHFEKLYWYQTVPNYKILSVKSCQKMVTDLPVCLQKKRSPLYVTTLSFIRHVKV